MLTKKLEVDELGEMIALSPVGSDAEFMLTGGFLSTLESQGGAAGAPLANRCRVVLSQLLSNDFEGLGGVPKGLSLFSMSCRDMAKINCWWFFQSPSTEF